jgi:hypothetical protein
MYRGWPDEELDSRVIERQDHSKIAAPDSQHDTDRLTTRVSRQDLGGKQGAVMFFTGHRLLAKVDRSHKHKVPFAHLATLHEGIKGESTTAGEHHETSAARLSRMKVGKKTRERSAARSTENERSFLLVKGSHVDLRPVIRFSEKFLKIRTTGDS